MKISLLYRENAKSFKTDCVADFGLNTALSSLCPDIDSLKAFTEILSSPLSDRDDIIYRRDILKDFSENRNIFGALLALFKKIDEMNAESAASVRKLNSRQISKYTPPGAFIDCLSAKAFYLGSLLGYVREAWRLMSAGRFASEGLIKMRCLCGEIVENPAFAEAEKLADTLSDMSPESGFRVVARVAENFCLNNFELLLPGTRMQFIKNKKSHRDKSGGELAFAALGDEENIVSALALRRVEAMTGALYKNIYMLFDGCVRELLFFDTALRMIDCLRKRGMPYCFPEIMPAGDSVFSAVGLYDFILFSNMRNTEQIVKNNVDIKTRGTVIFGGNGSGKTVLLRAMCTARLFAQSGLPVCADHARISPKTGIFSLIAAAEERFGQDEAGRFEGEAARLSLIIDNLKPGGVLYINEIFQTTAYDAAAEGIFPILEYLKMIGAAFACVTHLDALISKYRIQSDDTSLLTSRAGSYVFETV